MYKRILSIVLALILFTYPCFTVYANDNYEMMDNKWEDLNLGEKIACITMNFCSIGGKIINVDAMGADKLYNDLFEYIGGYYEPDSSVSDMTINDLKAMNETDGDEWYKKYCSALENMGATINENGLKMTDDACTKIRGWLDEYEKNNLQPLYYICESYCLSDLKASDFGSSYIYNSVKNIVDKYDYCFFKLVGNTVYLFIVNNLFDNCFFVLPNTNNNPTSHMYYVYDKSSENKSVVCDNYSIVGLNSNGGIITIDDNGNLVCSVDSVTINHNNANYTINPWHGNSFKSQYFTLISKDKYNYKTFTSLANYQDYITSTYEPNVYYTSNYFKTENIQESPVSLDEMVKLYECYDELCQKILQYVKDTQNADDTAVIKKLDELIQAVYSTGSVPSGGSSSGSTDVNVNTDMSETNSILNKILEEIKKIHDTPIDVGDSTIFNEWNTDIKNMILNPDININTTIGNMKDSFSDTVNMLKKKFPFSIPWDIYFLLSFLADTPETPKYEIPFKLENYGIDEVLVIDMERFSVVSKISRMLLTLLYMVALMQLTIKVLGIGKDK